MSTVARFSFLQLSLVLAAALVGVAFFPIPRRSAPRWSLVVQDAHGLGIAGLPLSERWRAGFVSPGEESALAPTDAKGAVTFPARTSSTCLVGSVLATVRSVVSFGAEASAGATVSMGPSQEQGLTLVADPEAAEVRTRVVRKDDDSFVEVPW